MSQHKRGVERTQTALLPPTLEDYAGAQSMVRVIDAYVSSLDLAALGFKNAVAGPLGASSYGPEDLLRLYLYGYWQRIRASRQLAGECERNVEVMWLMRQLRPCFKTVAEFRSQNAAAFEAVCAHLVQFLREIELVGSKLPTVAVDGSKFKASASRASMVDAKQAAKQREKIRARIGQYLAQMDEADEHDEGEAELSAQSIEAALKRLCERDQKLEQAQADLAAQAEHDKGKDKTPRVGLTDPDCAMLTGKGAVVAGYNVQQAVDTQHKLIVAHEVTTRGNDHTSLEPMARQAQEALKADAMTVIADTGYMNGKQAQACEDRGITPVVPMAEPSNTKAAECYAKTMFFYDPASDTYRCPAGEVLTRYKHDRTGETDYYWTSACAGCEHKARCTKSERRSIARSWYAQAAERAHARARDNRHLRRLRSATAEHPFGNLKAILSGGFLVRTLAKVKGEMALAVLSYNLKRTLKILGIEQFMQKLRAQMELNSV
jgi:transposase